MVIVLRQIRTFLVSVLSVQNFMNFLRASQLINLDIFEWFFVAQEAQATEDFGPSIILFILPVLRIRIRDPDF
jgi:hypothetical protein